MVETHGRKGFVIIGITQDPKPQRENFIKETGSKMIVAFEPGLASMRAYGFTGFPSAALVNPKGKVVWIGHPASLDSRVIEKHLKSVRLRVTGALTVDARLPAAYANIVKKLAKGDLGYGLRELHKKLKGKQLDAGHRKELETVFQEVEALRVDEDEAARKAFKSGRYAEAERRWKRLVKHFRGHEALKKAKQELLALKDPALRLELEAGRRILKAQDAEDAGDKAKALALLKQVTTGRLAETKEARRARELEIELGGSR